MITLERFGSLATYRIDNKKQKQEKKKKKNDTLSMNVGTCRNAIFFTNYNFFAMKLTRPSKQYPLNDSMKIILSNVSMAMVWQCHN